MGISWKFNGILIVCNGKSMGLNMNFMGFHGTSPTIMALNTI